MNKIYDAEYKKQAVELILTSGKSIKQVARELGCSASTLGDWKRKYDSNHSSLLTDSPRITKEELYKQNQELKKELKRVKEEREILKKATVILGN